jgi:hypothetical protein
MPPEQPRKHGTSISELLRIKELSDNDQLVILDKSDMTQSPFGSTKSVTVGQLIDYIVRSAEERLAK